MKEKCLTIYSTQWVIYDKDFYVQTIVKSQTKLYRNESLIILLIMQLIYCFNFEWSTPIHCNCSYFWFFLADVWIASYQSYKYLIIGFFHTAYYAKMLELPLSESDESEQFFRISENVSEKF